MTSKSGSFALAGMALLLSSISVIAADMGANRGLVVESPNTQFTLVCENGRNYPIRNGAISDDGDLVTGNLYISRNKSVHIRLVPMGTGYRYIGRGMWFDGSRGEALIYFSKNNPIACNVIVAT